MKSDKYGYIPYYKYGSPTLEEILLTKPPTPECKGEAAYGPCLVWRRVGLGPDVGWVIERR